MRQHLLLSLVLITAFSCSPADPGVQEKAQDGPFIRMRVERLPSMNTPRGAHAGMVVGGELTVFGGHTDGFVRTQTAEYFRDGVWHEVPMYYAHDGGFAVPLADGTVMLGGGSGEDFGIGQSWGVEIYEPQSHSCRPVGILDRKRAYASAYPLPDGQVLVSGNWYAADALELYTPGEGFSLVKELPTGRERPLILPAGDDYIIFGGYDPYGERADSRVDRLFGDAYQEPFLDTWVPYPLSTQADAGAIGRNTFLFLASRADDGQPGLVKVTDGVFSLLEMETPLPTEGIGAEKILFNPSILVDRPNRHVWLLGAGSQQRAYLVRVDYDATLDGGKASAQIYYADCPDGEGFSLDYSFLRLDDGFAMVAGCKIMGEDGLIAETNFFTAASVWKLSPEPAPASGFRWWLLLVGLAVAGAGAFAAVARKKEVPSAAADPVPETDKAIRANLVDQMIRLIEEKELWKKEDLRLDDIVQIMASNRTYVSTLLNSVSGVKFSTLINGYRVAHAQKLLLEHPEMLMDVVAEESGFSSRTAFYRNFKARVGMTPKQWQEANPGKTQDKEAR